MAMSTVFKQSFCIADPELTEKNLPDQAGKVSVVTGGYAGVGLELVKILYQHNGTVYVAGRSKDKAVEGIAAVKKAFPDSKGQLDYFHVDLADLASVKKAAAEFLSREKQLHVLTNNAGVMVPPKGSVDAQGHELQIGTNCLGPFLLTKLLLPLLEATAETCGPAEVRVTWAGSIAVEVWSPENGIEFDEAGNVKLFDQEKNYGQSKTGNVFLASEFARRYPASKVVHLAWNPGNLKTDLQRHMSSLRRSILNAALTHPPIFGAYTELWAGYSKSVSVQDNGRYVHPWGRFGPLRKGIEAALTSKENGGLGVAGQFWDWCEREVKSFT